ncbi:MAG: nicotinamide riboside transporter PnuC [Thermoanaerobaculia bacterium]
MSAFELVAAGVTLAAVWLTARQIIWCWPVALVSVSLYAVVFYQVKLYADMGLQGIYFVLSIYGWWAWLHGGEERSELQVSKASWRLRAILLAIGATTAFGLGWLLSRWTDASLPFMDSALAAFSLVAQWMMTRKLLDSWIAWIAIDVFYVGMYVYKELYPTAGLYAVFLLLAAMGYVEWKRSMARGAA